MFLNYMFNLPIQFSAESVASPGKLSHRYFNGLTILTEIHELIDIHRNTAATSPEPIC